MALHSSVAHLLACVSVADVVTLMTSEISRNDLFFLYNHMVENDVSASKFQSFATAMRQPNVCVDVDIEQRFCIRAQLIGKQGTESLLQTSPMCEDEETGGEETDDEDEL